MKVTFYGSALCPRCHFARRMLLEITRSNKEIEVEEIDVLTHPLKTCSDGIRIFPALKIGDRILGGIFLGRKSMETFIAETRTIKNPS
jgi:glutaredoxin